MPKNVLYFVERLKNRRDDVRNGASIELQRLVSSEFRALPAETVERFVAEFSDHIFRMVSSQENHQKRGAVQAIAALIPVTDLQRMQHYSGYVKTAQASNDVEANVLAAKALGVIVQHFPGYAGKKYYEKEVEENFNILDSYYDTEKDLPSSSVKPLSAVLVLKELATVNPTYFSKFLSKFFETIFLAVEFPRQDLREGAIQALSAIFRIIVVREPKERTRIPYYDNCLKRVLDALEETSPTKTLHRDDLIHGNLLLLNELLRFSNLKWEQKMKEVEDIIRSSPLLPKEKDSLSLKRVFKYTKRPMKNVRVSSLAREEMIPAKESKICKTLLSEKFEQICSQVMRQIQQKNLYIHKALWELLPRLAAFSPMYFVKYHYLERSLQYLVQSLKREKDRSNAFISVGLLALAVGDEHMNPTQFLEIISDLLPSRKEGPAKKRQERITPEPASFACLSLLVRVNGPRIYKPISEMLPSLLQTPLTGYMAGTLSEICQRIPNLKADVQRGLLDVLSRIIMKKQLTHPGDPMRSHSLPDLSSDPAMMVQALKTLGQFDFEDHSLLPFIKYIADNHLCSDHRDIRLEVVRTCCLVLSPKLQQMRRNAHYSPTLMSTVQQVLKKLMSAGVTDRDAEVRRCVLESLTDKMDEHLAQKDLLDALFLILNDEVFEIRELALCIIGRLSSLNPAHIMPLLRKVLVQILTELEYSGVSKNTEESARMLAHLLSSAPKLVKPYMQPSLKVLLPLVKVSHEKVGVTVAVMGAIGEQAQVSGPEMHQYLDELLPIVLEMMQDSASVEKRDMSLWTLAQLVESTGYVILPYEKYPSLLQNLLHILETEGNTSVKREVLRVLGLLGALDPFKHKLNIGAIESDCTGGVVSLSNEAGSESMASSNELLVAYSNNLDEFYSAMTLNCLTKVLREQPAETCVCAIALSIGHLISDVGMRVVPYLHQLLPALLNVIRCPCIHELAAKLSPVINLIKVVGKHISTYLEQMLAFTKELWEVNSPMDPGVMDLVQTLVRALGSDFKVYIPRLLPHALKALNNDLSQDRKVTDKLLDTLVVLGSTIEEYLHLLLPPVIRLFEHPKDNIQLRTKAMQTVDRLADDLDVTQFSSMIVHSLIRTIDSDCPETLRDEAIQLMSVMVFQLRKKFLIFRQSVDEAIRRNSAGLSKVENYFAICDKVLRETSLLEDDSGIIPHRTRQMREQSKEKNTVHSSKQRVGQDFVSHLTTNFDKQVLSEDWLAWLDTAQIATLSQAADRAVRWCSNVSNYHSPLHKELFTTAFLSCWMELSKEQQQEVVNALQYVLTIQDVAEVTHSILNLAEFMEHLEQLPLDVNILATKAFESRAYAKALRYREQQFIEGPTTVILESLILINNKLQQPEGAAGILEYAKKFQGTEQVREGWYEKLHDWNSALEAYRAARKSRPEDTDLVLGQMRCLEVLGEWDSLYTLANDQWETSSVESQAKMARMASAAAWGLKRWQDMKKYTESLPRASLEFAFHQAVLAVHEENYLDAQHSIDKARDLLEADLTALAKESYPRAYPAMVQAQMLAELEEVIQYKLVPERREHIKQKWWDRLAGCQAVVEDWQRILQVHSLVAPPQEDSKTWLKFASLCRNSGRLEQSRRTLITLLGSEEAIPAEGNMNTSNPEVAFAFIKHMWREAGRDLDKRKSTLNLLHRFSHNELANRVNDSDPSSHGGLECRKLLSKCYLKCGHWKEELDGVNEKSLHDILYYLTLAKEHNKQWYKAWHSFAYINYEAILLHHRKSPQDTAGYFASDEDVGLTSQQMLQYTVPAVHGFFRSIALSDNVDGSSLQDTLRLLTLWFNYGHWPQVFDALTEGMKTVPVETWLQVITQLIARIDMPRTSVARLIQQLLMDISRHHPQALVYPLTVALKSNAPLRSQAANVVLSFMSDHSPNLVSQAQLVSQELIRVSILWSELWHEGLEEASRLYFGERNVNGMLDTLKPLHEMMQRGAETLKETSFQQAYGADLSRANDACQTYRKTGNVKELGTAWDLYYNTFRRISKQLPQLNRLELQHCSPKLLSCTNLELAVPGSYNPNQPVVKIQSIQSTLDVISSKQRPRKLIVKGSDGRHYTFLLKGHEDLRQDERVMQLFGLVNTLLISDPETSRRNLTIQRYSVIPLSTNSGLIGWVPHCDTLHTLIKDHRDRKKILLNIEHRIMQRMAPHYEHLPLMQKVEVFEYALETTHGQDLAHLLWLKSPTSEEWFERRTNYTRSLAVMSMVGYILGLGDRHPSNLMLRTSGKILHIDFGDCFEVAMMREKFPEKIPFRLTRMLIQAMEVTGIEGTYRKTCEKVLKVLRHNKDSLMAVLEAFVYDPLFNWRLVEANAPTGKVKHSKSRPADTTVAGDTKDIEAGDATEEGAEGNEPSAEAESVQVQSHSGGPILVATTAASKDPVPAEALNRKAIAIINRVRDKLTGCDFDPDQPLEVQQQVELLIRQATNPENLCQCYIGWCPFW